MSNRFVDTNLDYITIVGKPKSKGLTPDQKRIHWEVYAQKALRFEDAFKRVFESTFDEQKHFVSNILNQTGQLPGTLNDETTAQRFGAVIELVYHSAFEDAVPNKGIQVPKTKQLDEFARNWIATRSLTLAKGINQTTLEAIRTELGLGFEAGESIKQLTKRIEGYFDGNARMRAERVARTEIISASNEGALHRYELEGIEKSEFYNSSDACEECLGLAGEYLTSDMHGMIPAHPNCRCVVLAVIPN
jgi:SPP1 gp7 family putative phage head morphogenesis protein